MNAFTLQSQQGNFILTDDGQTLAVQFAGNPANDTIILVHGYPDTHAVWAGVVADLAQDFHVVTFDARGAGQSTRPLSRNDFRLECFSADLKAIIDTVSPNRPVHLVGHDWGSIHTWESVTDPSLKGRIASFTSISGPCLDHMGHWLREKIRQPSWDGSKALLKQAVRSWYIFLFHLPAIGWLWMLGLGRLWPWLLRLNEGIHVAPTLTQARDGATGVNMYRANMLRRLFWPRERHAQAPVQLLIPTHDHFVGRDIFSDMKRWVPDLWVRQIEAAHWLPLKSPQKVAIAVREFIASNAKSDSETCNDRKDASHIASRYACHTGVRMDSGRLVVITGAGSGIGRATALAYAERGATVVAADIDRAAAERTAVLGHLLKSQIFPYQVDVGDSTAMEAFAQWVATTVGTPDIVINNAGIGMAGGILDTSTRDWTRILGVNVWGVIHGSRLFARQMIDAGNGGHIVNIASAAAFSPSRTFPAYATTKAAAHMLTECMRAELAGYGIGVSAVYPGFVDTGIATSTHYVGVSEEEQQRRRHKAAQLYQWRGFGAERVATAIVGAVDHDRAQVLVGIEAKGAHWLGRISPALRRRIARIDFSPA